MTIAPQAQTQASAPPPFRLSDVSMLTARLAQILAEEVDLLGAMKISQIDALQKEKLFLINALEAQKKLLARHPSAMDTIPSQDKDEFETLTEVFNDILGENHRKLQLAKEVNQYVVKAITRVVNEHATSRYYDGLGTRSPRSTEVLSVTLNKTV